MTAAGGDRDGLSIGSVITRLRDEFPDITISKIRFLESEGLLRPGRTSSGYRQFTTADIERLRYVLTAQRDHYLPLKVIKQRLDSGDGPAVHTAGLSGPAAAGAGVTDGTVPERGSGTVVPFAGSSRSAATAGPRSGSGLPRAQDFAPTETGRMNRQELLERSEIDAATLGEIERYGLIRPASDGSYDDDDSALARTVAAMTGYGIEPRHLRAFRASADREVGLLEQILAPVQRHGDAEAAARTEEMSRELAALSVSLHTLLVKAGIRGMTER